MFEDSLPRDFRARIAEVEKQILLQQILLKERPSLKPNNTQSYWAYKNASESARSLLAGADENHRAFITITTKTKDARRANEALSRVIGKFLVPHCSRYVRFFHRSENGFVHVHVLAILKWPIMREPYPSAGARMLARQLAKYNSDPQEYETPTTKEAKQLARSLSSATCRRKLGFVVEVGPVDDCEAVVEYAARYLKGVAAIRRYPDDNGIRLYSISHNARIKLWKSHYINPAEKLVRLKMAAFAAHHGAASMREAKLKIGRKWAHWALQEGKGFKLRAYPLEEDFIQDWGGHWTPEALGVRIKDPNYSPNNRRFSYRWAEVEDLHRALVDRQLSFTWDLPDWVWPGNEQ